MYPKNGEQRIDSIYGDNVNDWNLIVESEGLSREFPKYVAWCTQIWISSPYIRNKLVCPFTCAKMCGDPPSETKTNKIDQFDYYCEVGCVLRKDQSKFFASIVNSNIYITIFLF